MTLIDVASSRSDLDRMSVRMLVTVQEAGSRRYRPVGFLERDQAGFRFAYLRQAVQREDFQPLTGLHRAVQGAIVSESLFPIFAERVISSGRPDRAKTLATLVLPDDAEPFEILERTHGLRVGDTIELLPAPSASPQQRISFTFWVHGVRYLGPEGAQVLDNLEADDELTLRPEPLNPVNPEVMQVLETHDEVVGWVPDPLVRIVDRLRQVRLSVVQSNPAHVGFHFRLLVRVNGVVDDRGDLFGAEEWATV